MNRIITGLVSLLMLIGVGVLVLKLIGLGDVVDDVGAGIRKVTAHPGKPVAPVTGAEVDAQSLVAQSLGWNIAEVNDKPVSVVQEGLRRVESLIDRLETQRQEADVLTTRGSLLGDKATREFNELRETLRESKKVLENAAATYPLQIKGMRYADRDMLLRAFSDLKARYDALKGSMTMTVNNPEVAKQTLLKVDRQLKQARMMQARLKARLEQAYGDELGKAVEGNDETMTRLDTTVDVLTHGAPKLPTGPVSIESNAEREVMDFND